MWRTSDGDRVLTEVEWNLFAAGLDILRCDIEDDIENDVDETDTGVPEFDKLTAEQKLSLLADTALALRDQSVPTPRHTAANEGAIMAVFTTIRDWLREEVEIRDIGKPWLRNLLLATAAESNCFSGQLPRPASRNWDVWDELLEWVVDGVLWDRDYELGREYLDLPPDECRATLKAMRIDPEYFLTVPAEPGERGLIAARQTLAQLLGRSQRDTH